MESAQLDVSDAVQHLAARWLALQPDQPIGRRAGFSLADATVPDVLRQHARMRRLDRVEPTKPLAPSPSHCHKIWTRSDSARGCSLIIIIMCTVGLGLRSAAVAIVPRGHASMMNCSPSGPVSSSPTTGTYR